MNSLDAVDITDYAKNDSRKVSLQDDVDGSIREVNVFDLDNDVREARKRRRMTVSTSYQ